MGFGLFCRDTKTELSVAPYVQWSQLEMESLIRRASVRRCQNSFFPYEFKNYNGVIFFVKVSEDVWYSVRSWQELCVLCGGIPKNEMRLEIWYAVTKRVESYREEGK